MNKKKVLLVEDDEDLCETIVEFLESKGLEVMFVTDGEAAIAKQASFTPDVILMDIKLPGIDGYEVAREIRNVNKVTPILFMTGTETKADDRTNAFKSGGVDYIEKPFYLDELLCRIQVWLKASIIQENYVKQYKVKDKLLTLRSFEIVYGNNHVLLSDREFVILSILLDNIDHVVDREFLIETIWHNQLLNNNRMLTAYIFYLKRKLKPISKVLQIEAVYNAGYRIRLNS